jgi:hypothetical protein
MTHHNTSVSQHCFSIAVTACWCFCQQVRTLPALQPLAAGPSASYRSAQPALVLEHGISMLLGTGLNVQQSLGMYNS